MIWMVGDDEGNLYVGGFMLAFVLFSLFKGLVQVVY
jgi:hypothetical protein